MRVSLRVFRKQPLRITPIKRHLHVGRQFQIRNQTHRRLVRPDGKIRAEQKLRGGCEAFPVHEAVDAVAVGEIGWLVPIPTI